MYRIFRLTLLVGGLVFGVPVWSQALDVDEVTVGLEFEPLDEVLHEIMSHEHLKNSRVGVRVDSLLTGETIFSQHADWLINPASVTKLFSSAAALCLLKPHFRFKTELYTSEPPVKGVIKGGLYLKGYADPYLVYEKLLYLAYELSNYGIKKIEGPIVVDQCYFDHFDNGPGWEQDNTSRPYEAPMGALSLNFNSVAVWVFPAEVLGQPARVELFPNSEHFKLVNQVTTSPSHTWIQIDSDPWGVKNRIVVRGRIAHNHPGYRDFCKIYHPALYTGHSFREALALAGIQVGKTVRVGTVPSRANLLYTLASPALGELVRKVNKLSQNFMSEQLYKTLGAELMGPPGSYWKGQQVINTFLEEEVGIPQGSYILHNGSGLNDVNRISPTQVVQLLRYMHSRFDVWNDFAASLAVAGSDGTVLSRFAHPSLQETMRLKTGSLSNVRALAGYIHNRGGESFVFSFLVSDYKCSGFEVVRLIDRFAASLSRTNAQRHLVDEIEVLPREIFFEPTTFSPKGSTEAEIPIGEINTASEEEPAP